MDWTSLAVQIPILVIFIWYIDRRDKAAETRNDAQVEAIKENTKVLSQLLMNFCSHDTFVREVTIPLMRSNNNRTRREDAKESAG
jgi:hypothetical protein